MFPLFETIQSLKKAKLAGLMLMSSLLAGFIILAIAIGLSGLAEFIVNIKMGWLDNSINVIAGVLAGIGGWFMLPALIPIIAGMFQERVIHNVEEAYYPENALTISPRFWPDFKHDVKFTLLALFLNVLLLPFYVIGIGLLMSVALNAYLLGREFFESAAGYHLGKPKAKELIKTNKIAVYGGGLCITGLTLIPFLNIFTPILAICWMTHLYNGHVEVKPEWRD